MYWIECHYCKNAAGAVSAMAESSTGGINPLKGSGGNCLHFNIQV